MDRWHASPDFHAGFARTFCSVDGVRHWMKRSQFVWRQAQHPWRASSRSRWTRRVQARLTEKGEADIKDWSLNLKSVAGMVLLLLSFSSTRSFYRQKLAASTQGVLQPEIVALVRWLTKTAQTNPIQVRPAYEDVYLLWRQYVCLCVCSCGYLLLLVNEWWIGGWANEVEDAHRQSIPAPVADYSEWNLFERWTLALQRAFRPKYLRCFTGPSEFTTVL